MSYIPKTITGLRRKLMNNKKEIMQLENDIFLFKKGRGMLTELEDVEDAKRAIESMQAENLHIKEEIAKIEAARRSENVVS